MDHIIIYPSKLLLMSLFFACVKDGAGAALKNAAPAPGSDLQKFGSGAALNPLTTTEKNISESAENLACY